MVHISIIEARLSQLGFKTSRWFKPEIRELQHILWENEELVGCVQGRYFGGFALLVATNHRLLLIDKKIPYLSVEDIRYDMISEIDYSNQMFDATVNIYTINKQHRFSSWKHKHHLRTLVNFAQQRVMQLRQYQQQDTPYNSNPQPAAVNNALPAPPQPAPTMAQSYNYGQTLHLQPPNVPTETRQRLPSPHVPRIVGAAAVAGARHFVNPYTRGSFVMRKQWGRSS